MQLKDQLLENTDALIQKMEAFSGNQFNTRPAPDVWSAADVLEHLYRSEFGLVRLFSGESQPVTDRAPDALVDKMKKRLLESDKPMKAGGVILPTEGEKSKPELIQKFAENRAKVTKLIQELPPEELCLKYKNPVFGHLTRLEWVHFSIFHTQRHMRQLDRITSQL